ncbi:MAG: ABC transporter ATP-binding protein [Erysipelotrichaceae bacterium]|nr:ABC transporter ATP-binding protein [Erysipelotrichaceae bacterium]
MKQFQTKKELLFYFLNGSKRYFLCSILFACLSALFDLINPKIIEFAVDHVIGRSDSAIPGCFQVLIEAAGGIQIVRQHLSWVAAIVLAAALLGAGFRYLFTVSNAMGAESMVQHMRDRLFSHILNLPYAWHSQNHTGDIIQRCTSDVETIKVFVSEQLTSLFRVILLIVLSLTFMIRIHFQFALITSLFIPVIILGSVFFHHRIGSTFEQVDAQEGLLSSIAQENLTGVRVVRAFGKEAYEMERFQKQNHGYTDLWVRLQKTLASFWVYGNVIAHLRDLLVTVLGIYYCVQGSLTAGGFIAFFSYTAMLSLPVRGLGRIIAEMSKAGISLGRIQYIMNAEPECDDALDTPDIKGDVSFENVSFSYEEGAAVLRNITFDVKAGETLGILGVTGSGKSTLMYLLDRLYDLPKEQGVIKVDGKDIQTISRKWLRQHIGMVLQEPYLFSRSISDNINITTKSSSIDEIERVSKIANLDEAIDRFEDGYETYVGERGVTLSGGQKQRTAIAQMLFRKPPIMIFDDSFSAVDTETDNNIRNALQKEMGHATVLLIAHRITTLMNADRILVMDKGKIVQQGTHEQLLREEGIYKKTYLLQTQGAGDLS